MELFSQRLMSHFAICMGTANTHYGKLEVNRVISNCCKQKILASELDDKENGRDLKCVSKDQDFGIEIYIWTIHSNWCHLFLRLSFLFSLRCLSFLSYRSTMQYCPWSVVYAKSRITDSCYYIIIGSSESYCPFITDFSFYLP